MKQRRCPRVVNQSLLAYKLEEVRFEFDPARRLPGFDNRLHPQEKCVPSGRSQRVSLPDRAVSAEALSK